MLKTAPEDWRQQSREQKIAINQFHIAAITEHFRQAVKKDKKKAADLPLDQRLANYIIEGTKDGLVADLDRKRAEGAAPLDIINGPLMAGMTEVGRLFNNNELIVAEVLQSAEAMKAAVTHLEQFMEKSRHCGAGQDRAGDREGRRPRYREKPGRDYSFRTTVTRWSISGSRFRPRT